MKQAVMIIAHRHYEQLVRLINYFDGKCDIFVHVDKKATFSKDEISKLKKFNGVCEVYQKYHLSWGGFSILKTEIFLLEKVLKKGPYKYYHLISGQDYPLKPLDQFLNFFENTETKGFLNCNHMPTPGTDDNTFHRLQFYYFMDYVNFRTERGRKLIYSIVDWQKKIGFKRRVPDQLWHLYCGSAWFSIDYDSAKYLLDYTKNKSSFYRRMKFVFVPEEIYVSSVLLNSPFESKISRFDNCRHILWNKKKCVDSPFNAEMKNLKEFIACPNLYFARKFEYPTSNEVMDVLDKYSINTSLSDSQDSNGVYNGINYNRYLYDYGLKNILVNFCKKMNVKSVVDFGCGPAWYVAYLRESLVDAAGFDANPNTSEMAGYINRGKQCCFVADLTEDLEAPEKYEMSMLLNVGQYISKEYEDTVISNLTRNTTKYILVNWEKEGDGVNCVSKEYLEEKFKEHQYVRNNFATMVFRESSCLKSHKENIILFERNTIFA